MGQEMYDLKIAYDKEERAKNRNKRIKNDNHSNQGRINQAKIAAKAAADARKAHQENLRHQQVNNFLTFPVCF